MSTITAVRKEITVAADPERAFSVFTERLADWWPLTTHSLSVQRQGAPATWAGFEDGRLFEVAADGQRYAWGEVTVWEPSTRVAFTWRINHAGDLHTDVDVTFSPVDGGTLVVIDHTGWDVWAEQAEEKRRSYETGWDTVLAPYAKAT
jgi:uncharacterized protein YndB with AHSA1/START domain